MTKSGGRGSPVDRKQIVKSGGRGAPTGRGGRGAPTGRGGRGAPTGRGGRGAPTGRGGRGAPTGRGGRGAPISRGAPINRGAPIIRPVGRVSTPNKRPRNDDSSWARVNSPNKRLRNEVFQTYEKVNKQSNEGDVSIASLKELLKPVFGNTTSPRDAEDVQRALVGHAGSRALQTALKHGHQDDELLELVFPILVGAGSEPKQKVAHRISVDKFGHAAICAAIRYLPDDKFKALSSCLQEVGVKLLVSTYGGRVWENLYAETRERYGADAANEFLNRYLLPPLLFSSLDGSRTMDLMEDKSLMLNISATNKEMIIARAMKQIMKITQKRNMACQGTQLIMGFFLMHADEERKMEVVNALFSSSENADESDIANSLQAIRTFAGVRNVALMVGLLSARDRRNLISLLKSSGKLSKMLTNEAPEDAWLLVLRLLYIMDDTKKSFDMLSTLGLKCEHIRTAGEETETHAGCPFRLAVIGPQEEVKGSSLKKGNFVRERSLKLLEFLLLSGLNGIAKNKRSALVVEQPNPQGKKQLEERMEQLRTKTVELCVAFFQNHIGVHSDVEITEASIKGHMRDLLGLTLSSTFQYLQVGIGDEVVAMNLTRSVLEALREYDDVFGRNKVVRSFSEAPDEIKNVIWKKFWCKKMDVVLSSDLVYPFLDFAKNSGDEVRNKILKDPLVRQFAAKSGKPDLQKGEKLLIEWIEENTDSQ